MPIRVSAPVRIDISGGWPDSNKFRERHGGVVLSGAINLRVFSDAKEPYTIHSGNALGYSGLGASGARDATLFVAREPKLIDHSEHLIREIYHFQNQGLLGNAGLQDQAAAVYGGVNLFLFGIGDAKFCTIDRQKIPKEKAKHLQDRLVLINTGKPHLSSEIHELVFGNKNYSRNVPYLRKMKEIAELMARDIANETLMGCYIKETGELQAELHTSIETDVMRELKKKAKGYFLGAKITGAGQGGCMIFYTRDKPSLIEVLSNNSITGTNIIPFEFDYEGIKIQQL